MPHPFAGLRIKGDHRVRKEIISRSIAPVIIVGRCLSRHVEHAEFFVDRHGGPMPNVARVLPGSIKKVRALLNPRVCSGRNSPEFLVRFQPGVDAELPLFWHRIKPPQHPTGASVIGHHVARNVHRPHLIRIADVPSISPRRYAAGMKRNRRHQHISNQRRR